jgi:hypothetical protein
MLDSLFCRPRVRARMRANPLGNWLESYVAYLDARGHPQGTIQQYAQAVEHFGGWVARRGVKPEDVTRATIDSFLHEHLPHCQCPAPGPRSASIRSGPHSPTCYGSPTVPLGDPDPSSR